MVPSQSCGYSLFPGDLSPERSGSKWQGLVTHVLCGSTGLRVPRRWARPQASLATILPPCFFVFSVVPWEFLNSLALPT